VFSEKGWRWVGELWCYGPHGEREEWELRLPDKIPWQASSGLLARDRRYLGKMMTMRRWESGTLAVSLIFLKLEEMGIAAEKEGYKRRELGQTIFNLHSRALQSLLVQLPVDSNARAVNG
jgi:hypothetical protein